MKGRGPCYKFLIFWDFSNASNLNFSYFFTVFWVFFAFSRILLAMINFFIAEVKAQGSFQLQLSYFSIKDLTLPKFLSKMRRKLKKRSKLKFLTSEQSKKMQINSEGSLAVIPAIKIWTSLPRNVHSTFISHFYHRYSIASYLNFHETEFIIHFLSQFEVSNTTECRYTRESPFLSWESVFGFSKFLPTFLVLYFLARRDILTTADSPRLKYAIISSVSQEVYGFAFKTPSCRKPFFVYEKCSQTIPEVGFLNFPYDSKGS